MILAETISSVYITCTKNHREYCTRLAYTHACKQTSVLTQSANAACEADYERNRTCNQIIQTINSPVVFANLCFKTEASLLRGSNYFDLLYLHLLYLINQIGSSVFSLWLQTFLNNANPNSCRQSYSSLSRLIHCMNFRLDGE